MIVSKKNKVTIPKALRRLSGIGPGTRIEFRLNGAGEVILVPVGRQPSNGPKTLES